MILFHQHHFAGLVEPAGGDAVQVDAVAQRSGVEIDGVLSGRTGVRGTGAHPPGQSVPPG